MNLISGRMGLIDTSAIRKVFDLAAKIRNPVNLSIGQPDFPVPEAVKEALIKAIRDDKNGYTPTQGILPLREAIAERWQREGGFRISPENVVVSTGVAGILYLLFEVMFDPGDEILLIDPYFLIYESLAGFHRLKTHTIPETFTAADLDKLRSGKIKAVIFSSPSNPSGKILSEEQLHLLADFARKTGAVLVSDEIYEAYDYDGKFRHMASIAPEVTLTLSGFSKSHAMTGLRVGYIGAPENLAEITGKIATLQQYSMVCSPAPAQWAAITALQTSIAREIGLMKSRRDLVVKIMEGRAEFTYPDGAFYLYVKVPIDCQEFIERAISRELLLVPGHIFSSRRDHVRISYAQEESVLKKGLEIFLELLHP